MDSEQLENYKRQRLSLEKSFINGLNNSLQNGMEEWNSWSSIKQIIYRQQFDIFINDVSKKLKEEINRLRTMKKSDPELILHNDIEDVITGQKIVPTCQNKFEWKTKFRKGFIGLDCFARMALFNKLDCYEMWDDDIKDIIESVPVINIADKEDNERETTMFDLVMQMSGNHNNLSDFTEETMTEETMTKFLDTTSGQMFMNI